MASQPTRTLQDVVFAAHFASAPLTVLDGASWVEEFNSAGLDLEQHPVLPPVQLTPAGQLQTIVLAFPPQGLIPRLFLRRHDVGEYCVFQNDRVAFAWHRVEPVGEEADYPGYDELRTHWRSLLERFNDWCERRLGGKRPLRLIELGYQNAYPIDESGSQAHHVPSYFKLAALGERRVQQFHLAWREVVPDTDGGYVDAVGTIGTVPPAQTAFLFNFVGIAPVAADATSQVALGVADRLHTHITNMHVAAIAREAF